MELGVVLQPHLGRVFDNYKPTSDMFGVLTLAKVIKVHHKSNTVDIQFIKRKGALTSDSGNEGKQGVRVLTQSAHYEQNSMSPSGVVEPMLLGQIVVVSFLDGDKNKPIILGSIHNTTSSGKNILTKDYPLHPADTLKKLQEANKYLKVFPSQFYTKVDGVGGVEVSHPSRAFLKIDAHDEELDDGYLAYEHEDLTETNPVTGATIGARLSETQPSAKILFSHVSAVDDGTRERTEDEEEYVGLVQLTRDTWTKIFISEEGLLRFTRDNNDDKVSYVEFDPKGRIKIRRQQDDSVQGFGYNNSELVLGEDGEISLIRNTENQKTEITITKEEEINIKHHTGSIIQFTNNGDIIIKPKNKIIAHNLEEVISNEPS